MLGWLERLDRELRFDASDTVITLGDYVDRGPQSRGVIDYLRALRNRCNLVTLRGNHEIMMLQARVDRAWLVNWLACGGDRTLDSYGAATFDDIPQSHWKFLEETIPFHESDHDFFVHANACPDLPLADQPFDMLYWEPFGQPGPHQSGRRMICGHTSQKSGRPLDIGHAVCIDTYAHGGGWLMMENLWHDWGDYRLGPVGMLHGEEGGDPLTQAFMSFHLRAMRPKI